MVDQKLEATNQGDYYQKTRRLISRWTEEEGPPQEYLEYFLAVPDFVHLGVRLSVDSEVSWKNRIALVGTATYLISPIDLIPATIFGPIGLLDDFGLAAYVLRKTMNETDREQIHEHWAGRKDMLIFVEDILDLVVEEIGLGPWKKLISTVESFR